MAVSDKPWASITEADYADAADFCSASLIDLNEPGTDKVKSLCKLPVREPRSMGGNLNRAAVIAATAVLAGGRGGVDAPPDEKRAAARKLLGYYRAQLQQDPPESLVRLAQG
jgi:hypothetical protein